jgi:hypothetical protein
MNTKLTFGEPITNIVVSLDHPYRFSYFVEHVVESRKNKYGVIHRDRWIRCTDKKGEFWKIDPTCIVRGHITEPEPFEVQR